MFVETLIAASLVIPHCGVVEGFYGRPWPHEGRVGLMKFMGDLGLNTYIYGPKDDPYHHAKWRDPYPAEKVKEFGELLSAAKANRVDFYWAVHLGDAFTNSAPAAKEAEYKALFAKLDSMYAIGFRAFAAFFDDFGGTNAVLHAEICNRIVSDFLDRKGDCPNLIVCPNVYVGDGSSGYCRTMGACCCSRVEIMWTGQTTCANISTVHSEKVAANYRRAPFVWWNWPVNDFCREKLVMGRMYGIDPYPFSGFVLNPMENLEASKIAIYCAAKYTQNPKAYDSKRTWADSFAYLYGPKFGPAMRVFCEHNSDPARANLEWLGDWNREESVVLSADGDLRKACVEIRAAMKVLMTGLSKEYPALWMEIQNWIRMLDAQALERLAVVDGDRTAYEAAKVLRAKIFEEQKAYFAALAPDWDKKNCTGCATGTRILQPLIEKTAKSVFGSL